MNAVDIIESEGLCLLEPDAPPLKRLVELEEEAETRRVFIAGRHGIVKEILSDEMRFSLEHYDRLLADVAGPTRYFVSDEGAARNRRAAMLLRAQVRLSVARGEPASGPSPQLADAYRAWIARIARREARQVLASLKARRGVERVNFVREFVFLVAYRVARQVTGVPGPERPPSFARLYMFLRNLSAPGRWIPLRGELGAAMTLLSLAHPLFAHVFGTVLRSPAPVRMAARWGSRQALRLFDQAMATPETAPSLSLLRALADVRAEFPQICDEDYETDVRSILFELSGALLLVVGKSLSECVNLIAATPKRAPVVSWDEIVKRLSDAEAGYAAHDAVINEMMRFAAPERLARTVRNATTLEGIPLEAGDRIIALVDVASMDPTAFPDPCRFAPSPKRPYLTSGPFKAKHVCYGRIIAWTVMRETLVEAAKILKPAEGAELRPFFGLPDDMTWTFCEPTNSDEGQTSACGSYAFGSRRLPGVSAERFYSDR